MERKILPGQLSKFEHRISSHGQHDSPRLSLGGILADVMGLGKTLTMLSAIVLSLDDANHFMLSSDNAAIGDSHLYATKATIVAVPSARKSYIP